MGELRWEEILSVKSSCWIIEGLIHWFCRNLVVHREKFTLSGQLGYWGFDKRKFIE